MPDDLADAVRARAEELAACRWFPIQTERGAKPHPLRVPWSVAELAYSVYAANYGRGQSLERLAERGGFGPGEMDAFLPDWRDRCDEIERLRARADAAEKRAAELGAAAAAVRSPGQDF